MRVPPGDHIGGVLTLGVPYEVELLEVAAGLIRPGDVVVDVGANIGNHAVFWAVCCGAHVVAFEPNPAALAYLEVNVEANGLSQIEVQATALGSQAGNAAVLPAPDGNLGACRLQPGDGPVPVMRLDDVVTTPVRLVKVDVEGSEADVLAGAAGVLERDLPFVIAECADDAACRDVDAVLSVYGYRRHEVNLAWTPTYLWTPPPR
jgi:FkbM family methyltransferase